jgi:glyoxylase-like metal-dependent hydrolase (beta-lactamase superfamily II)
MSKLSEFSVEEAAPNVFRLGTGFVGFYLIADGGRYTMIDSGLPGYWNQLEGFLAGRGSSINDIEAQVLTHYHIDHRGNSERVQRESGGPVYIHETDEPFLYEVPPPPKAPIWKPGVFMYLAHLLKHKALKVAPVVDPSTFVDGETLDVPGQPKVVHVPGHTMGHSCLLLEEKNALITGDALGGMDFGGAVGPRLAPSFVNEDSEMALESLSRIEGLNVDKLLTVHGPNFYGPIAEAVRMAREVGIV